MSPLGWSNIPKAVRQVSTSSSKPPTQSSGRFVKLFKLCVVAYLFQVGLVVYWRCVPMLDVEHEGRRYRLYRGQRVPPMFLPLIGVLRIGPCYPMTLRIETNGIVVNEEYPETDRDVESMCPFPLPEKWRMPPRAR